jgi:uncharacterized protein (TIGR02453 family)
MVAKKRSADAIDAAGFTGFPRGALTFLRGLARNNRKEWFEAHRDDYERSLRAPMRALVEEVDVRLARFAPEIVGSPRKSMFRIHRDVRFSRDKSPYKTHAACWFFHRDAGHGVGSDAAHGGAGFYFHLAPTGTFCGGGIWMPPRPALQQLRERIAEDPDGFIELVTAPAFRRRFGALDDDAMLVRMPRGFAPDHPAATWLRHQSFTAGCEVPVEAVASPTLPDLLAKHFEVMTPFVRWLNGALGLRPATAR